MLPLGGGGEGGRDGGGVGLWLGVGVSSVPVYVGVGLGVFGVGGWFEWVGGCINVHIQHKYNVQICIYHLWAGAATPWA